MEEIEFNLTREPWIRLVDCECHQEETSLEEALIHAHEYESLSGELPTQDVVILRLMLAVLHTVFSRVDIEGEEAPLEESEEAYERWKTLWDAKKFPEKPIREYFERWRERFWLFHPERPFGQMAGLDYGTEYDACKLNGEISQSNNKTRLFSSYSGEKKGALSYAEAARWLLYLNAYDDTSAKKSKEKKEEEKRTGMKAPSPGAGWLGKLGLIYIKGETLFETLMLNLPLVQVHRDDEIPEMERPIWERLEYPKGERIRINAPDNLAELYTLQSRRLLLRRDQNGVTGFRLLGGDFFEKEEAMIEPMTVWRVKTEKGMEIYSPKRHDPLKQVWRDFSSIFVSRKNADGILIREPGVITWNKKLMEKGLVPYRAMLNTRVISVQYGDKDFFVIHLYSDELSMQRNILSEMGQNWQAIITDEIEHCRELADAVGRLSGEVFLAAGGDETRISNIRNNAREQLYYRLDSPFRSWLKSIEPVGGVRANEQIDRWHTEAKKITRLYAAELVRQAGGRAIVGRAIKKDERTTIYSAPKAMNKLQITISKIYNGGGGNNK